MNAALLVAEPEPATREFLERHLLDDGFDVLGAEAEREALELAERLKPSLVLSSQELCRRLREGAPGRSWDRDVPVIVLGLTEADPVDRVRAFDRGCDDYVPRPFHYDELLARIPGGAAAHLAVGARPARGRAGGRRPRHQARHRPRPPDHAACQGVRPARQAHD